MISLILSTLLVLAPIKPSDLDEDPIAAAIMFATIFKYPASLGRRVYAKQCRTAPGGCEARLRSFARMFRTSGKRHGVSPWILASVAYHESRFIPAAEGRIGESGIVQISKTTVRNLGLAWHGPDREKYRAECLKTTDACQAELVDAAAGILARGVERCGSILRALAWYNTGRTCTPNGYARKVARLSAYWSGDTEV